MIANDILLPLRSRLRDQGLEAKKPYYWSDGELLDYLDSAFQEVATRLGMFSKSIPMTKNNDIFMLPKDFSGILSVSVNGKICIQKSYAWVSRNKALLGSYTDYVAYLNYDGIRIYPTPANDALVELDYSYTKNIKDIDTDIELPSICKNLLLFNCLYLANQKETEGKMVSLKKSEHYRNLYEKELADLKETIFEYKSSKNIRTKFRKV